MADDDPVDDRSDPISQSFLTGAPRPRPIVPLEQQAGVEDIGKPPPQPEEAPQPKQAREKAEAEAEAKKAYSERIYKQFEEQQKRDEPLYEEQERRLREPLPDVPEQKKVPRPPPQDLGQNANSWLMAASVMAGFAGLASRRSSINALSAFSGALDGFAAGDKMRFDANYQHWKAESDATIQNNKAEMDRYNAIIKRRDLDQTQMANLLQIEATRNRNEFVRQVAAEAARTGDTDTLLIAMDGVQGKIAEYEIGKQKIQQQVEAWMARDRARYGMSHPDASPEDLERRADLYESGQITAAFRGYGVNTPNMMALGELLARRGHSADEIAAAQERFRAGMAGATIAGGISSRIGFAAQELARTIPNAIEASDKLPRGDFKTWNQFKAAANRALSSQGYARFDVFHDAVVRSYARLFGGGTASVHAQEHAEALLSQATSPETYRVQLNALWQEAQNATAAAGDLIMPKGQLSPPSSGGRSINLPNLPPGVTVEWE